MVFGNTLYIPIPRFLKRLELEVAKKTSNAVLNITPLLQLIILTCPVSWLQNLLDSKWSPPLIFSHYDNLKHCCSRTLLFYNASLLSSLFTLFPKRNFLFNILICKLFKNYCFTIQKSCCCYLFSYICTIYQNSHIRSKIIITLLLMIIIII